MATKKVKADVLKRSRIIQGHFAKVIEMIESDRYCLDVLNQSLAVQNALKKIDEIILEDHLNTCVVKKINQGKSKEAAKEVVEIFKRR
ncbi:metal-sensing transcriptional repressor [Patescibacteria group bacterium]|nr:metal-sensing transcriptional repressor [Patescibacteria group bacterium]